MNPVRADCLEVWRIEVLLAYRVFKKVHFIIKLLRVWIRVTSEEPNLKDASDTLKKKKMKWAQSCKLKAPQERQPRASLKSRNRTKIIKKKIMFPKKVGKTLH